MQKYELFMYILFFIVIVIYICAFFNIILKKDRQSIIMRRYYNAVCNIYSVYNTNSVYINSQIILSNPSDILEQLNLNYEKLCQSYPNNSYSSILDLLQTLIYYYDTRSDKIFKNIFEVEKNKDIRQFMVDICAYIKEVNPFISIPKKEADLLQSIKNALISNNESLGSNALTHLSQEIENKEKLFLKQSKQNQRANVISIVGIILTIFFGFFSFFKF